LGEREKGKVDPGLGVKTGGPGGHRIREKVKPGERGGQKVKEKRKKAGNEESR